MIFIILSVLGCICVPDKYTVCNVSAFDKFDNIMSDQNIFYRIECPHYDVRKNFCDKWRSLLTKIHMNLNLSFHGINSNTGSSAKKYRLLNGMDFK